MSNFLAIATVTETLRQILETAAAASKIAEAKATAFRPTTGTTGLPAVGVNLYLYQVMPNSALRNVDQPSRRSDGTVVEPPQIALDLHYLLTFYGKEAEFEPQRVMGSVLQHLNSRPLLTRESIRNAKKSLTMLAESNLDEEVELVRLMMTPMNLEEMSKLWSVLFQTPYVPSIVYQASVVLIQAEEMARPALPVHSRNLYIRTFRQPVIDQILSRKAPADEYEADRPIVVGDTVCLRGRQFRGDVTRLKLGNLEIMLGEISDIQITFQLNMPPFPALSLRAGVQGVQVVQYVRMGTPESDHAGDASNVAAFVLRPTIAASAVPVSSRVVSGVTLCTDDITLNFTPNVGVRQRVALILNEYNPPDNRLARAYHFDVSFTPPNPSDTSVASIVTQVKDVVKGDYLVRVQVDGAESPLKPGPDPSNPIYFEPKVTIS